MTEEVKPVEAAPTASLSATDIASIVAAAVKEAMKPAVIFGEKGPEAVTRVTEAPAPAPVTETEEQRFARYFEAQKAAIVTAVVQERGLPARAGFVANPDGTAKPLHEMSGSELTKASREVAEALLQPGVKYPGINRNNEG